MKNKTLVIDADGIVHQPRIADELRTDVHIVEVNDSSRWLTYCEYHRIRDDIIDSTDLKKTRRKTVTCLGCIAGASK